MRIAFIGPFGFHPNKTMRARAFRLARELVKQGHAVKLFMPPWQTPDEADKSWQEAGVELRYVPLSGGVLGITRQLMAECRDWQPGIVHCFKPKAYAGIVGWWWWRLYRHQTPLVIDSDDWEGAGGWNEIAPYSWGQKRFFAWQEKWGLTHCHALTVASKALQTLAWGHGAQPTSAHYLPNGAGIDVSAAKLGERDAVRKELGLGAAPTLLLYSRLFEFDQERLLAILSQVFRQLPEMRLLLVGGELFAEDGAVFREGLQNIGLLEKTVDAGWVAEEDLPALLAAGDAGIYLMEDTLLNRAKCPVKLADMAACGLSIVGERVGQVAEYVHHNQTGFLHPSGDHVDIAGSVVKLLTDEKLRAAMSAKAQRHFERNFRWESLAGRLEQVYQGLLTNRG